MTEETQQAEQNNEPTLSIGDIMIMKQIVEVATARGALRANELTQVGAVYDRVSAWIDSKMPPEEVAEDTGAEESTEENSND